MHVSHSASSQPANASTAPLPGNEAPSILLQAPGAGLPPVEAFLARYLIFPLFCRRHSTKKALHKLEADGEKILQLARQLPMAELNRPVLIPRLPGLEDSSRNWSVAMTIEHLHIVGQGVSGVLRCISMGQKPPAVVGTAEVKPHGDVDPDIVLDAYEDFIVGFRDTVWNHLGPDFSTTHPHPWFGPLNSGQWLRMLAMHQQLHAKQIQRIAQSLA